MSNFELREDAVVVRGTVRSAWLEPFERDAFCFSGRWHIMVELATGDPLLSTADGKVSAFGWLDCVVTPVSPYRDQPRADRLLAELVGQKVYLAGSWGDVSDGGVIRATRVCAISRILVDRGITPLVEEHGFSQVVRDVDVFAFSDDTPLLFLEAPPHHQEDRHLEIEIAFPFRPQRSAVPTFVECVDRDDAEGVLYQFRSTPAPGFPAHVDRQHLFTIEATPAGDILKLAIDTGLPANNQGFFYTKIALTYDEAFATMCHPDACLSDPNSSCQKTTESRLSYVPSTLSSALAGDLLLGPAGGTGVLGRLLGALEGPQFYDHMVMFVEDDGHSVRHCTASDERIAAEAYYTDEVTVWTPFGPQSKRLPLHGIRHDVLQFGWPGTISQSLSEVCVTGRNTSNPQFSFAGLYPEVLAAESASPPLLWQLAPAERDKRTSFHDPESAGTAKRNRDGHSRARYSLAKLQKDPAFRKEIDADTHRPVGWIWPILVKPHPMLAASAAQPLRAVAAAAKDLSAHYRFFSYTKAHIAVDPAHDAPPAGSWSDHAGVDWAAGTKAAVCSSFVWAAVQAANEGLRAKGLPRILLEGEGEPEDHRAAAELDGLYQYTERERGAAAKALFQFTHDRVTGEVDKAVDALPALLGTLLDVVPGVTDTIDDVKQVLGNIVANQLCNTFAADTPADLGWSWQRPGTGIAVSPDDTSLRWDVRVTPTPPPPAPAGRLNVYGNPVPVMVPQGGWRTTPIYRVDRVLGKGRVRGRVVRRMDRDHDSSPVMGATVRLGCRTTSTALLADRTVGFDFVDIKAGRYDLQAFLFVVDKKTMVGQEWRSQARDVQLRDGDDQSGIELELVPPPGVARTLDIRSHHDIVDRVVIGKDRWGHYDVDQKIQLAFDPLDNEDAPPEQQNTKWTETWTQFTPAVGSGVQVKVSVSATLKHDPGTDPDGTIVCDVHIVLFDTSEGETDGTLDDVAITLAAGDSHETPYNMASDDTVPERASGTVTITNLPAALP